jgi:hypothetical protein
MSQNRKPSSYVRKDEYVPGIGRVLTMGNSRQIVIQPSRRFENCSRLIDAIFKTKTGKHEQKRVIPVLPGHAVYAAGATAG